MLNLECLLALVVGAWTASKWPAVWAPVNGAINWVWDKVWGLVNKLLGK